MISVTLFKTFLLLDKLNTKNGPKNLKNLEVVVFKKFCQKEF